MSVFVVVAALRIQSWLRRTPDLYLLRGASEALAHHTRHKLVADAIPGGIKARVHPAAPDIDGVVVLEADTDDDAGQAARWLLSHLANRLPAVEWRAWAHSADSYVGAYQEVSVDGKVPNVGRWHRPPAMLDLPLGTLCEGCAQETATGVINHKGKVRLGPDCRQRFRSNDWSKEPDTPTDFEELATVGGLLPGSRPLTVGRRDATNHLATIAADGNRMGDVFKTLAVKDTQVQQAVSRAVADAASTAVEQAKAVTAPGAAKSVVIKHYVGGDDLLLSVPARFAWQFATSLAESFQRHFAKAILRAAPGQTDLHQRALLVTLGIGLVFSQVKYPFAHASEVAESAMAYAKRTGRGSTATIAWCDLTVEADASAQRSISVEDARADLDPPDRLDEEARLRREILHLSSSARDALAGILNEGARSGANPALQGEHILRWARRTDRPRLASIHDWDQERIRAISDLVDRARWWPRPAIAGPGEAKEQR